MSAIDDALAHLTNADTRRRDVAAAELGDLLSYGSLTPAITEQAVIALVGLALTDHDHSVIEQALHSIDSAFEHHQLPLRLVAPLTQRMPTLTPELLDYALNILACTHDPAAKPMIDPYLEHPNPEIRHLAADALAELPGRAQ